MPLSVSQVWLSGRALLLLGLWLFPEGSIAVSGAVIGGCCLLLRAIQLIRLIVEWIVLWSLEWEVTAALRTLSHLSLLLHLTDHLLLPHHLLELDLPHGLEVAHPHDLLLLVAAAKLRTLLLLRRWLAFR